MLGEMLTASSSHQSVPLCDDNGVDRAQIREMLRLTPEQRLARVQEFVESVFEIQALNEERPVR
jgi:hypothetical protein